MEWHTRKCFDQTMAEITAGQKPHECNGCVEPTEEMNKEGEEHHRLNEELLKKIEPGGLE
jgi:hypothetical protein